MNILQRFAAFVRDSLSKPQRGELTGSTKTLRQWMVYDRKLTPRTRQMLLRNPYIYSALRNTSDELAGKWNGASGYAPADLNQQHLTRPPQILAASDSPQHQRHADHLRWNIDSRLKRGWDEVIRQLLRAREHGKSVQEMLWAWQPNGAFQGTWVIDDIIDCDPDAFSFRYERETNRLTGEVNYRRVLCYSATGSKLGMGKAMPERKFLVYSFDKSQENDEGISILNKLDLFDWYQRNNFIFWMTDLNRYGSPLMVGTAPKNASKKQRDALLAAIDSIQQETGILITEGEKLELLQAQRNGATGFQLLDALINKMISVVITGNALTMEGGERGSFALAQATTSEIRVILLYALATAIDSVINRQLIPAFMAFNYPGETEFPRHQLLPPRAEEVSNPVSPSNAGMVGVPALPMSFAKSAADPVDTLIDRSIENGLSVIDRVWQQPVRDLITSAESPEDAQHALQSFQPDAAEYADLLQRVFLAAHLNGRWQIAQSIRKTKSFADDMTDAEINQLLQSPIAVEAARKIILSKKLMDKHAFEKLSGDAKRLAFTISGQENLDIMRQVQAAVADAVNVGATLRDIERAAIEAFQRYGVTWQTPYHAETVFRTNIESALNDAKWQMINTPEIQEHVAYLEYVTRDDPRVRPTHHAMHGVIRPASDPVWRVWFPPNGYNCRCSFRVITHDDAEKNGIQPTPNLPTVKPDDGFSSGPGDWWKIK